MKYMKDLISLKKDAMNIKMVIVRVMVLSLLLLFFALENLFLERQLLLLLRVE
jgi:hypothetical protein